MQQSIGGSAVAERQNELIDPSLSPLRITAANVNGEDEASTPAQPETAALSTSSGRPASRSWGSPGAWPSAGRSPVNQLRRAPSVDARAPIPFVTPTAPHLFRSRLSIRMGPCIGAKSKSAASPASAKRVTSKKSTQGIATLWPSADLGVQSGRLAARSLNHPAQLNAVLSKIFGSRSLIRNQTIPIPIFTIRKKGRVT